MAIRFVTGQSATTYDGTIFNDVSLSGVQTGSFLILAITGTTDQEVTGISSNSGTATLSGWTRAAGPYSGDGLTEGEIWWARVTSGGTVGVHPTGDGSDTGYSIHEFRNVSTGTAQVGTAQNYYNGSVESLETGTISVTAGDLLFAVWASERSDRTLTWGDGGSGSTYTQLENANTHIHKTAYKIAGSDGSFSAECSWTTGLDPILMLVAFDAAPPTEITTVVDPDSGSGYDYDSLSDWEADLGGTTSGDLPADNEIAVAKCRCTGGTADTQSSYVDIAGWTTDSTHYIKIWTDPSESYRHNGTYQTGNKYRIDSTSHGIICNENYVYVDGLAIYVHGEGLACLVAGDSGTANYIYFSNCVLKGDGNDQTYGITNEYQPSGSYLYVWNCMVFKHGRGIYINAPSATHYIYSCTIANNNTTGFYAGGASSVSYCKNVLCDNIAEDTDRDFAAVGTLTNYNCASAGNTAANFGGSGNREGQTFSYVDEDNDDYHLQSTDAGAKGYGLNLYNDANYPFQTDIDGDDRGGSGAEWDIGADEYIDSYQLPVNRQYIRGATATWYEVVDVYVLKDGVFVPDKIIKILDSGSWI